MRIDPSDEIVREVGLWAVFDEIDAALTTLLPTQPRPRDRREVRGDCDHLRASRRCQQERRLAQQLARAGHDRDLRIGYRQHSGSAPTQAVEEPRLVLVRHVEIAVAHDSIQQIVHGLDGRVGDQTQGGLVEIDALLQRWVSAAVDQRWDHREPFMSTGTRPLHLAGCDPAIFALTMGARTPRTASTDPSPRSTSRPGRLSCRRSHGRDLEDVRCSVAEPVLDDLAGPAACRNVVTRQFSTSDRTSTFRRSRDSGQGT